MVNETCNAETCEEQGSPVSGYSFLYGMVGEDGIEIGIAYRERDENFISRGRDRLNLEERGYKILMEGGSLTPEVLDVFEQLEVDCRTEVLHLETVAEERDSQIVNNGGVR